MQIYTESSYNSPHSATNYGIFCLRGHFLIYVDLDRSLSLKEVDSGCSIFCLRFPNIRSSAQKGGVFVLSSATDRIEEREFKKVA